MKKYILIIVSLIFVSSLNLKANRVGDDFTKKTTSILWEDTKWDFGKIERNKAAEHNFVFTNTTNTPVVLTNVKSSCGCTVTNYDKTPILPGKKGNIKVKYDAKKMGRFMKSVTISLNNGEKHMIKIEGKVGE